jgi:hypothetical protein
MCLADWLGLCCCRSSRQTVTARPPKSSRPTKVSNFHETRVRGCSSSSLCRWIRRRFRRLLLTSSVLLELWNTSNPPFSILHLVSLLAPKCIPLCVHLRLPRPSHLLQLPWTSSEELPVWLVANSTPPNSKPALGRSDCMV